MGGALRCFRSLDRQPDGLPDMSAQLFSFGLGKGDGRYVAIIRFSQCPAQRAIRIIVDDNPCGSCQSTRQFKVSRGEPILLHFKIDILLPVKLCSRLFTPDQAPIHVVVQGPARRTSLLSSSGKG